MIKIVRLFNIPLNCFFLFLSVNVESIAVSSGSTLEKLTLLIKFLRLFWNLRKVMEVLGWESEIDLPVISVAIRIAYCCSIDTRKGQRTPPSFENLLISLMSPTP